MRTASPLDFVFDTWLHQNPLAAQQEHSADADFLEPLAEYAQSLALALEPTEIGECPPTHAELDEFREAGTRILSDVVNLMMESESTQEKNSRITRRIALLQHLFFRGHSFAHHHFDLVQRLAEPHDAFLRENYGTTTREIIVCIHEVFRKVLRQLASSLANPTATSLVPPYMIYASENTPQRVLDLLSANYGDNRDFLTFDKAPGWPTNSSVLESRPLIRHSLQYCCPNPWLLVRTLDSLLDRLLCADSTYAHKYRNTRHDVVVELAGKYLSSLLPGSTFHSRLYYKVGNKQLRCETDAVLIFDNRLFIIECKGQSLSLPARRGAPGRLKRDYGALIKDPYDQATRTLRYLQTSGVAPFEFEDGRLALTIDVKNYRHIYPVCVTGSHLGPFAAHIGFPRRLDLLNRDDSLWSIFINDLRVISELLESPTEFLLFLDRRLAVNDFEKLVAQTELDLLGLFLATRLDLDSLQRVKSGLVQPYGFVDDIESYYRRLQGLPVAAEKPRLETMPLIRLIISQIEQLASRESSEIAENLLAIGPAHQSQFCDGLTRCVRLVENDGDCHEQTIVNRNVTVGISARVTAQDIAHWKYYCKVKQCQTKSVHWHLICAEVAAGQLQVKRCMKLDDSWRLSPQCALDAGLLDDQVVEKHTSHFGCPPRNGMCPCNSGKKYKKCHGR